MMAEEGKQVEPTRSIAALLQQAAETVF